MSNAAKLGLDNMPWGISGIMDWVYSDRWHLALTILLLTVGLGELTKLIIEWPLMGIPFLRPRFYGYLWGDPLLAIAAFTAFPALERFRGSDLFYAQAGFFWLLFGLGYALTMLQTIDEWKANRRDPRMGYVWQQQILNPSKFAHSLIFGPALALLGLLLVVLLVQWRSFGLELAIVAVAVAIYLALNFLVDPRRDTFKLVVWGHPHRARFIQLRNAKIPVPEL